MVNNEHFLQFWPHPAHRGEALRIHEDNAPNVSASRQLLGGEEGQFGAVQRQKGLHVAVDAARQDRHRRREELVRS